MGYVSCTLYLRVCLTSAATGNIMQIELLGQPLVIVGSHQTAVDMLERKTSMYSDRPRLTVARLVGWDRLTALLPYSSRWRETRRLFAPALGSRASVVAFEPIMNVQITRALPRMMLNPRGLVDEVYRYGLSSLRLKKPIVHELAGPWPGRL